MVVSQESFDTTSVIHTPKLSNEIEETNEIGTEQEIEEMNLENEIRNIHEYFTDDRRGSKRSSAGEIISKEESRINKKPMNFLSDLPARGSLESGTESEKKKKTILITSDTGSEEEESSDQDIHDNNQVIIEASIPKYKLIDSKTYYEILILNNTKLFNSCYLRFNRRYSQFNELRRRVKKILSTTLEFPPKRWTLFGISEDVKIERKNMLNPWIKYLFHKSLENDDLLQELKKFVENDNYPETKN